MSLMNMMAQSREQPILLAVVVSVSLGAYLFYKETERNAEQSKKQVEVIASATLMDRFFCNSSSPSLRY